MVKIDLHIHTTASDGKKTPREVVDWAIERGLSSIAITDHDEIAGSKEAALYAKDKNIEVVSGIEISCFEEEFGLRDIHIVGLFVNHDDERILSFVNEMNQCRIKEKKGIINKLNDLGYDISFEELKLEVNGGSFGRPHVANILFRKYSDKFETYGQIFDELLGNGKLAHVVREGVYDMKRAIDLIHDSGGIAILAHPGVYGCDVEELINLFAKLGGDGIEVDYNYEKFGEIDLEEFYGKLREIAKEKNLLISGGTDFHKELTHKNIGEHGVSEEEFDVLKSAVNS
ncbi:MAG: PHP domain-containing protein [Candidatus Pacearchaeota archaeon]|nr:PHP domain-containing protein [Candidatus Pacearchaeota archaeon]